MQLNRNIKLIRELSGKRQEDFARLIKTNVSNLKTYERTITRPKTPVLYRIAQIAGVDVEDLENKALTPADIHFKDDNGEKVETVPNGHSKDYLSGKNLENFSAAHRELVNFIVRVQSKTQQDHELAPSLVDLIQEVAAGKKQVPIDELLTQLKKVLVRDSGYKQ